MSNYLKEYKDYGELYDKEVLAYLVDAFLQLGFKPKEPLEKFKEWFEKRIRKYNISGELLEICIDNWFDYWDEDGRKIKNFKTSFFNNPMLKKYLKPEYKDSVNNL